VEKQAKGRRGGCNAHGRRGLVEALRRGDARALSGLELYAKIFHVDAESKRARETIEQRFERPLRDSEWVLDRKTWLFAGHETSAQRAADALTILTTCKKMGINPRAYLRETLAKILAGEQNLTTLLPETYAASRAERAPPTPAAA
jgi:hypothetical protein